MLGLLENFAGGSDVPQLRRRSVEWMTGVCIARWGQRCKILGRVVNGCSAWTVYLHPHSRGGTLSRSRRVSVSGSVDVDSRGTA